MNAETDTEGRMLIRRRTEGASCAPADSSRPIVQICKNAPELQRRSPDVAKDMYVDGAIPLLMKTLLDNGHLRGDCTIVTGRTIAENLKSVKSNLRQGLARRAPDGAIEDAAMSGFVETGLAVDGPAVLLRDGDIKAAAVAAQIINGNLTGIGLAGRQTKRRLRQTNHRSGARWKFAQEVGPAVGGAVTHPGGAHEKQFYAVC